MLYESTSTNKNVIHKHFLFKVYEVSQVSCERSYSIKKIFGMEWTTVERNRVYFWGKYNELLDNFIEFPIPTRPVSTEKKKVVIEPNEKKNKHLRKTADTQNSL